MEYKIYLDYTIELLSQIKIPSYIIDAPYTWDNQIDGGLRNNIFTQNTYMIIKKTSASLSAPITGIILHYLYMTAFHVNIYILSFRTAQEYS